MFMGEYNHVLDSKGRIIMPAKFREGLGERFVITRGLDNCLFVYPLSEWTLLEQKLRNLPFTRSDARRLCVSSFRASGVNWINRVVF